MSDALRESLPKLTKREGKIEWKTKLPKGVVSQETYEANRGKKASWTPK